MIPQNRLSTEEIFGGLLITGDPQPSLLLSNELGGVALNDASQGLSVKIWTCATVPSGNPAVPDSVIVYAGDVLAVTLFSALQVTEVSLAFDQNMKPFVAFVSQGVAKYYWYDTTIEASIISALPVGSTSPRATLDDHRDLERGTSDIIMCYIRVGNLYFRMQRDRYLVEYLLKADINLTITNPVIQYIKMNDVQRLQLHITGNFYGG